MDHILANIKSLKDNNEITENEMQYFLSIELNDFQDEIIERIYQLYNDTIVPYQSGDLMVYNSDVLSQISFDDFFMWIVENNQYYNKIFMNIL